MVVWEEGAPIYPTECRTLTGHQLAYHQIMGRIPGYYEWDDDSLQPGQKKEGGLHQNLFDDEGHLKGSARFIPTDDVDSDSPYATDYVTENVYVPAEDRGLTPEEEELAALIGEILIVFMGKGIEKAKPHVKKWWVESVRPFAEKKRAQLSQMRPRRRLKASTVVESESRAVDTDQPRGDSVAVSGPKMSSAEAQSRYLAAMAARAFSEEQIRMVQNADIIDAKDIGEVQEKIIQLPPNDVRELIAKMATDPSLLGEETLAELASVIAREGRRINGDFYQLPSEHD